MQVEYAALTGLATYIESMPKAATESARIALNDVGAGAGLALFRKGVADEINFPPGYLTDKRLGVTDKAKNGDLAVTITGRFRPTSLARFVNNPIVGQRGNLRVTVKRGSTRTLKRAFIVRLRAGSTISNDNFNLGLAIRLKSGEKLSNTIGARPVALDKGLYLLYGPSVDQVFKNTGPEEAPQVLELVRAEYFRQFVRLTAK